MNPKFDKTDQNSLKSEKSKTPINLRTTKNKLDLMPTCPSPINMPNFQIKSMLKEQIFKKNLADSKLSSKSSKNTKNFPFTNKKFNVNLLSNNEKDSSSEFQKFFQRDFSNPEILPLSTKQSPITSNKLNKLLKNLMPTQTSTKYAYNDTNLTQILASLKRDNTPGRLSQRSSTSEIRRKNTQNNLTPINRSRKNSPIEENKRSLSPKAPYLSIKDYLQGKNEKYSKKEEDLVKTPIKNEKMKKNVKNNRENSGENTHKKNVAKNEDLKITIKEELNEKVKNEAKKPDFLVNVNISIENNIGIKEKEKTDNTQKIKEELTRVLQQKVSADNSKEDLEKRKNLIENFKNYDSKLSLLINSQKKTMASSKKLNVNQEKNNGSQNKNQVVSKTSLNFFENQNASLVKVEENKINKKEKEEEVTNFGKNTNCEQKIPLEKQPNIRTLNNVIVLEETITNISKSFKENQKIIGFCKSYLNIVAEGTLEFFENMHENEKHKNVIKEMIILERIVVITVISLSFDKALNPKYVRNCINLMEYIHQNFIMFIELILEKVTINNENENYLENLKKILILKKTRDTSRILKSEIIRKNLTIILKILQIFVKENKLEPFQTISSLIDDISKLTITDSTQYLMQCFYSLIIELEEKIGGDFEDIYTEGNLSEEQLSHVSAPYLPELPPEKKDSTYTLVLDLDETLVHYEELEDGSGQFLLRPDSELFLEEMSKYFEVVIFTAALQDYADYILNIMDEKNQFISYRLYRKHTVHNGAIYVKDLSNLGRDLSKLIIIDNLADNFQNQPENGIFIQSWYGEPEDKAFYYLAPLLKEIVNKKYDDVRVALKKFREKMIENISKGSSAPHINLNLD